jgi:hypothetical protein
MSLEDYTTKPAAPADGSSGETDVAIMDAPPNYDVRRVDEQKLAKLIAWADPFKQINIAEELPEDVLQRIGMDCNEGDDIDETSRHDWLIQTEKALDLAMQKAQAKTEPWPGSSNVIYPLIAQAGIQFASPADPYFIKAAKQLKGNNLARLPSMPSFARLLPPSPTTTVVNNVIEAETVTL